MTATSVTASGSAWRRRLALALGLLASLPAARADTLAEIREAGVIRVCADPHNLPFSDQDLAPAGYELDIAGKIAEGLVRFNENVESDRRTIELWRLYDGLAKAKKRP